MPATVPEASVFLAKLNNIETLKRRYLTYGGYNPFHENYALWEQAINLMDEVWRLITTHPVLGIRFVEIIDKAAKEIYQAFPEYREMGEEKGVQAAKGSFTWQENRGIARDEEHAVRQINGDFQVLASLLPYLFKAVRGD